jgi:hypothetical protein
MVRLVALVLSMTSACVTTPLPLLTPNCEVWGVTAALGGGGDMRPAPVCFIRCSTGLGHTATESAFPVDCDQWEGHQVVVQRL